LGISHSYLRLSGMIFSHPDERVDSLDVLKAPSRAVPRPTWTHRLNRLPPRKKSWQTGSFVSWTPCLVFCSTKQLVSKVGCWIFEDAPCLLVSSCLPIFRAPVWAEQLVYSICSKNASRWYRHTLIFSLANRYLLELF
jgi:hypothetical protein